MGDPLYPASRLDGNQVLTHAFDETTQRLRTDAEATIVNADIDVSLDAAEDSVESFIVDENGNPFTDANYLPAGQTTHDNLNANANIQVANTDVSNSNPVPISDAGGSITVDGTITVSNPGLTDAQLRASSVPVSATLSAETTKVIGTVNISAGQSVTVNAGTNLNTSLLALDSTVAKDSSLSTLNTSVNTLLKPASTLAAVTAITNTVTIKADTAGNQPNALKTDGSATTQPVSVVSLPLPTGAATSALQTTGNASLISIDGKLPALVAGKIPVLSEEVHPTNSVVTSVNASITSVTLIAANTNRKGLIIYRSGTGTCYVKLGTTATITNYTIQMANNTVYELPFPCYTGIIDAIFSSTNGTVKITEIT